MHLCPEVVFTLRRWRPALFLVLEIVTKNLG